MRRPTFELALKVPTVSIIRELTVSAKGLSLRFQVTGYRHILRSPELKFWFYFPSLSYER